MLVLSRRVGQTILIGDNIAVTLVRIGPHAVRIGITAPREMNIAREELILVYPRQEPGDDEAEDEEVEADIGGEA